MLLWHNDYMSLVEKIKNTPIITSLVLLSLFFGAVGIVNIRPTQISEAATTDCFGSYATMYGNGGTTGIITGIANINIGLSNSNQAPNKIIVLMDGAEVGQARPESGSTYSWIMQIPTKVLHPKQYELRAIVRYQDFECITQPTMTQMVEPGGESEFILTPNKTNLELPVNNSAIVSAGLSVPGYTNNFAQFALFDWFAESRGTITNTQNRSTNFFSGPSSGQGKIKAVARYGFRVSDTVIYTNITSPNTPISSSTPTNTTTTTTKTTESLDSSQLSTSTGVVEDDIVAGDAVQRNSSIESNDITKDCATAALGEDRFNLINNGKVRPTLEEVIKLKACFARTNYIVPSNFAPVAPGEVNKLQLTNQAKIEKIENGTINAQDQQKEVLRFTGKAKPNTVVVIYIFSEPLVLTTTSNENGEWVYELENPLEPGDHTMYAVVDRGDGVYERTNPLEFAIGSAEATAENPAGLSLALNEEATATDSFLSSYIYVGSSFLIISAILLVAVVAYRHGKRAKASELLEPSSFNAVSTNQTDKPDDSNSFQNIQTVTPTTQDEPLSQDTVTNVTKEPDNQTIKNAEIVNTDEKQQG